MQPIPKTSKWTDYATGGVPLYFHSPYVFGVVCQSLTVPTRAQPRQKSAELEKRKD